MKVILAVSLAFLLPLTALAQSAAQENRVKEIQRSLSVAYLNFSDRLAKEDPTRSEAARFISDIANYKITMTLEGNGTHVVLFSPKTFKGEHFFGGAAQYEVDANSGKIVKLTLLK